MSTPNPGTTDWVPIWALQGNANAALYQLRSEKAQPSGYASLDAGGLVPVAQIPSLSATYQVVSAKGAANGYASLDGSTKVPVAQIPDLSATYQLLSGKGVANGYASLDAGGLVPVAQLPPGIGLPADTVVVAATRIISNKLLAGDTQPSWRVLGSGRFDWGPGGSTATDTNLYRSAVGVLKTDGVLLSTNSIPTGGTTGQSLTKTSNADYAMGWTTVSGGSGLPADTVVVAGTRIISNKLLAGDAQPSWQVMGSGQFNWGPGGSTATDTNLYRGGVGQIFTDGGFVGKKQYYFYPPTSAAAIAYTCQVQGEANPRFTIDLNGLQAWGPGSSTAVDTNLYRLSAQNLKTDNNFYAGQTFVSLGTAGATGYLFNPPVAAIGYAFSVNVQGEAQARHLVDGNGAHTWGPGGSTATDTTMYRSTVNTIRFSGTIQSGLSTSGQTAFMADTQNAGGYFLAGRISGDAQWRMLVGADGGMWFGPGGSTAQDAFLGRGGPKLIQSGRVGYPTAFAIYADNTVWPFQMYDVANAANPMFYINIAGVHNWGPGTGATDTNLYRPAAGYLKTDTNFQAAQFQALQAASGGLAFYAPSLASNGYILGTQVSGDTSWRVLIDANGTINWGPGNVASDTSLSRGGVALLVVSNHLWANGTLVANLR